MFVKNLILAGLLLGVPPALACPWQDYPYGGPNRSHTTGPQTALGGEYVYAFPPALPASTTGAIANMSVNPMPIGRPSFDLGFGGNGYSLYTGTYAGNQPQPDMGGGLPDDYGFGVGIEVEVSVGAGF